MTGILIVPILGASPGNVQALYRLGTLLSYDLITRDESIALLERTVELAPDAASPRRDLAWLLLARDPARGLELLAPFDDRQDALLYETKAAMLAALGRRDEADEAMGLALGAVGDPAVGYVELARYHLDSNRYQRALELARRIYDHPLPLGVEVFAEIIWAEAHRLAGAFEEIHPRLRERCAEGVPEHLAFEVYWGCRSFDHELAARAALVVSERQRDDDERVVYRVRAASELAESGDESMIDEVVAEAGDSPAAWAQVAYMYEALDRFDEADAAAKRAYELGPKDREALSCMHEAHLRMGQLDAAIERARELMEIHPYEHHGPERLGSVLGKTLEVEPALELTARALEAAPYCSNAHRARAVALFAAGELDEAARFAAHALAMDKPDEEDPDDECVMILRALAGDRPGVERCLATLHAKEPAELFAEFKARLLDLASSRGDYGG